jgi:polyisoprenoid-binding protein YceI
MTAAAARPAARRRASVAWLVVVAGAVSPGLAQPKAGAWTVTKGEVRVTCPLTVGGSFEAKTTALAGSLSIGAAPTTLGGELSVDLSTLDTGISLRNEHMRDNYLEVGKGSGFDKAVVSGVDVGSLSGGITDGTRPFSARLRLHGVVQPIAGRATLTRRGEAVRVEASFPVRLADYGIADPRYLGVGVGREVTVRVTFLANPSS